jgi:hypothetical protein
MGVNFSYCDAHWAYGLFHDFRCKLAREIGMNLDKMDGFGGTLSFDTFDDDIIPLLDHSDCEGELTPEECARVAPRLRQLIASWPPEDFIQEAISLAEGMEYAAKMNELFYFC